jgi:hypothetical protein
MISSGLSLRGVNLLSAGCSTEDGATEEEFFSKRRRLHGVSPGRYGIFRHLSLGPLSLGGSWALMLLINERWWRLQVIFDVSGKESQ